MNKILKGIVFALLLPGLAFAAYNDVTLSTDVTITSNDISLTVYGSSATLESIEVGSGSFSVTLASGSSIEVQSTDRKVILVSHSNYITTNVCSGTESRLKLENSGTTATITVTPSSSTCQGFANVAGSSSSGGGGPAPACEDSIDNDKDGLIDLKDPGCSSAADSDESNPPVTSASTPQQSSATSTSLITNDTTLNQPAAVAQPAAAAAADPEVSNLIKILRSLIEKLKSLGGTVSPALEETLDLLEPQMKYTFDRDLKFGSTGVDVQMLQQLLNTQGFVVAAGGPGSPGNETTVFGYATRAALIKFQKAKGIVPAVGYFGPKTRAVVNDL